MSNYERGSFGPMVESIQRIVGATKDGVWGPETTKLVKVWQKENGLEADGIVGPLTLKLMALGHDPLPVPSTPVIVDPNDFQGPNPFKRNSVAWYEFLYKGIKFDVDRAQQIMQAAKNLLAQKSRAYPMELQTRVPWALIGSLNIMEGGGGFDKYLGNGESIRHVTTIVPKGRGPFSSWEEGAMDALRLDGLTNVLHWSLGLELKYGEQFNGEGYMLYHHNTDTPSVYPTSETPYLWGCSNINDGTGKYTSDGHYNPKADANAQVGVATMLKQLEIMGEYKPVYIAT